MQVRNVFFFICFFNVAYGQIPLWGACPTVETQTNFDLARYMGKWFKVEAYFHFFELGLTCVVADYSLKTSTTGNPAIIVRNSGWNWLYGSAVTTEGEAYVPDPAQNPAKWKINFPNVTGTSRNVPDADYWVLDTDYDTYAVVWGCTSMEIFGASFMNAQTLWILGRQPTLPEQVLQKLKDRLRSTGINPAGLVRPDHDSCPGRPGFKEADNPLNSIFGIGKAPGTSDVTAPMTSNELAVRSFIPLLNNLNMINPLQSQEDRPVTSGFMPHPPILHNQPSVQQQMVAGESAVRIVSSPLRISKQNLLGHESLMQQPFRIQTRTSATGKRAVSGSNFVKRPNRVWRPNPLLNNQ